MPEVGNFDLSFHRGDFNASFEKTKDYLKNYKNVLFYKGLFPDTALSVKDKKFSFVHMDVDIYESTLHGLDFFYPRMNQGGVILIHDYISSPGVKKAVDDFFKNKIEPTIELSGSQCLIVRV